MATKLRIILSHLNEYEDGRKFAYFSKEAFGNIHTLTKKTELIFVIEFLHVQGWGLQKDGSVATTLRISSCLISKTTSILKNLKRRFSYDYDKNKQE